MNLNPLSNWGEGYIGGLSAGLHPTDAIPLLGFVMGGNGPGRIFKLMWMLLVSLKKTKKIRTSIENQVSDQISQQPNNSLTFEQYPMLVG